MKFKAGTFIMVGLLAVAVQGQVLLQPGDSFTYTFTTLPDLVPGNGSSDVPVGGFTGTVSSFDAATDVLLVEMFENGTNEAPLLTFVQEAANDGTAYANTWADFQGTVRYTMLSGSVTLESLVFFYEVPTGPETWEQHQLTVVPVRQGIRLEDLVPCSGPAGGGVWKNHGQYVSAIARTSRDLVRQGLMTKRERQAAIREAAHSSCGKKVKPGKKPKH